MTAMQTIRNSVYRGLARVMPSAFGLYGLSTKHDHYKDYGWPEHVGFEQFHRFYQRNSLATAAVDKTVAKTWETHPDLWESEKPAESDLEGLIRQRFDQLRLWQAIMNVDRRSMVGCYSAAIIRLADGQKLDQPVSRVPGGVNGIAGIIPAWQGQLEVAEWDTNPASERYGEPLMFQFNEREPGSTQSNAADRQILIHPDRVLIWSEDGTVHGRSMLEPGFNDLLDAEKVKGAGGEGFWKTSRGAPMLEAPEGVSMKQVQDAMGATTPDEAMDAMNEQVAAFQEGFDKMLMLGGMTVKPLSITLPQPKEFFDIPVKSFAASFQMPVRVLLGNETGERSSTEDAREWAQVCMSRRENLCLPVLREFVNRLVAWGILPQKDWTIGWASLLDATPDQQLDRAVKMASVNTGLGGEPAFATDEIREAAGYAPVEEADIDLPEPEDQKTEADPDDEEIEP